MARIRSIKPEFWQDEVVGALSPQARLLFIASWNLADDEGLVRWSADYLNASVFMYDGLSLSRVQKLMGEVEEHGLVFTYRVTKWRQTLGYIVNFRKHQVINRPQPAKLQPPSLQNKDVILMYAERDEWRCHLCGELVNTQFILPPLNLFDGYKDWETAGDPGQNPSPDHLLPRSKGGGDEPSNIRTAHVSCNKGRGNRDLPTTTDVSDSVPDSVNDQGAFILGREGKGAGKGREGTLASTASPRERDELFEALAEACEIDWHRATKSERGKLNKATGELRAVDATPAEVHRRAALYRRRWPVVSLTPTALAAHWSELEHEQARAPTGNDAVIAAGMDRLRAATNGSISGVLAEGKP